MGKLHEFKVESLQDTDQLARRFAKCYCEMGDMSSVVVVLTGPLGAGKTQFVRSLANAFEVPSEAVVSPTFSLCQSYQGKRLLHHLDVYRIKDSDEFLELGPEEWFDDDAMTLVEWGERFMDLIPADHIQIEILPLDVDRRTFRFQATTEELNELLAVMSQPD